MLKKAELRFVKLEEPEGTIAVLLDGKVIGAVLVDALIELLKPDVGDIVVNSMIEDSSLDDDDDDDKPFIFDRRLFN